MKTNNPNKTKFSESKKNVQLMLKIPFLFFSLTGLFCFADFKIKSIVMNMLSGAPESGIYGQYLIFREVRNAGASFNILNDRPETLIVISGFAVFISVFTVTVFPKLLKPSTVSGLAILCSGVIMNLIERIQNGFVTDYIGFAYLEDFPFFNISDVFIICGTLSLCISVLKGENKG